MNLKGNMVIIIRKKKKKVRQDIRYRIHQKSMSFHERVHYFNSSQFSIKALILYLLRRF